MTHQLPVEAEHRAIGCARQAIALQEDPRAREFLTEALDAGHVSARWALVDPLDLELGRMIEDPDGVLAVQVSVADRPVACIEATRLGIYTGPDGSTFACDPPEDQPDGRRWGA